MDALRNGAFELIEAALDLLDKTLHLLDLSVRSAVDTFDDCLHRINGRSELADSSFSGQHARSPLFW